LLIEKVTYYPMPPISQFPAQYGYPSISCECHSGNRRDCLSKRLIYVIIRPVAALQSLENSSMLAFPYAIQGIYITPSNSTFEIDMHPEHQEWGQSQHMDKCRQLLKLTQTVSDIVTFSLRKQCHFRS